MTAEQQQSTLAAVTDYVVNNKLKTVRPSAGSGFWRPWCEAIGDKRGCGCHRRTPLQPVSRRCCTPGLAASQAAWPTSGPGPTCPPPSNSSTPASMPRRGVGRELALACSRTHPLSWMLHACAGTDHRSAGRGCGRGDVCGSEWPQAAGQAWLLTAIRASP